MYTKANLIADFNISNGFETFDNNFITTSASKWKNTLVNDNVLSNYGLTQYDNGKANSLLDLKNITLLNNSNLKLDRIGKNDDSGNLDYTEHEIHLISSGSTVGNYLYSEGGYLNGVFKYHQYDIQYLPRQYPNGFTFETTLYIDNNTFTNTNNNSNIFLYLGIRAEDKFADSYNENKGYFTSEGSVLDTSYYSYDVSRLPENTQNIDFIKTYLKTEDIYIKNNGQIDFIIDNLKSEEFTLLLNNIILIKNTDYIFDLRTKKITLLNIENINIEDNLVINYYTQIDEVELVNTKLIDINNKVIDQTVGLNNNVIAFKFDSNKKIGYRKIDDNLNIIENYSIKEVNEVGWNHIVITFNPYTKEDYTNISDECNLIARTGNLKIYVNGVLYLNEDNFIEPTFNPLPIHRSKQIGVPYNISWGGGSFGLKYSYNFNENDQNFPYEQNLNNSNLLIEKYFDGYFKGGFQKLRIYDKPLNLNEIKNNYNYESNYYNIKYNKGGRIIFKICESDNNNLLFLNGVWVDTELWNNDGWNDLSNLLDRKFVPLYDIFDNNFRNIPNNELIMKDTINNKYYLFKFISWSRNNGGGFSYTRFLLNLNQLSEGIKFSDGTRQKTAITPLKSKAFGTWNIIEKTGFSDVNLTEFIIEEDFEGITVANPFINEREWDIFVNAQSYPLIVSSINEGNNTWVLTMNNIIYNVEAYTTIINNVNYIVFYNNTGEPVNYQEGDVFNIKRGEGGDPVIWFNDTDINFRGASIEYHAYISNTGDSGGGTFIGNILISRDSGDYTVSHNESFSGSSDIKNNAEVWFRDRNKNERNISFRMKNGDKARLRIHYIYKGFYGNDYYD